MHSPSAQRHSLVKLAAVSFTFWCSWLPLARGVLRRGSDGHQDTASRVSFVPVQERAAAQEPTKSGLKEMDEEPVVDLDAIDAPKTLLSWTRQGCSSGRRLLSNEEYDAIKPAYIFSARQESAGWLHLPIHATLAEALTSLGFQVRVRTVEDSCDVERSASELLARGITPLIISTSPHRIMQPKEAFCKYGDVMRNLASKGAYLVVYNSEPLRDVGRVTTCAKKWGARELWHYSRYVMDMVNEIHSDRIHGIKVRYMPAGCADALDFGVSTNSTDRDEMHVSGLFHWNARPESMRHEFKLMLGDSLHELEGDICSPESYRDFFMKYPIQLNVHSAWNPDPAALESFRVSLLLANKACVLSTHVEEADQQNWLGSVKFGTASYLRDTFGELRGNSAAIAACQEEQHSNFCKKFKPSTLIQNAGFKGTEAAFR